MGHPRPLVSILVSLLVLAATLAPALEGHAEEATLELTWENATVTALEAWDTSNGAQRALRLGALEAAAELVPTRWKSLELGAGGEFAVDGGDTPLGDAELVAGVTLELGDTQAALEAALRADHAAALSASEVERWHFVEAVHDAFIEWLIADSVARHLQEYRVEVSTDFAPLVKAAEQQLISQLDLMDIEVELAAIDAELALAEEDRADAVARLERLLLRPVHPTTASCFAVESPNLDSDHSPWAAVAELLDAHPQLAALRHSAGAKRAQADALTAQTEAWTLSPELLYHRDPDGGHWGGVGVSVSFPWSDENATERALLRGEADADEATVAVTLASLHAAVSTEGRRLDAARAYRKTLVEKLIAPLEQRVLLLEKAYTSGNVSFDRLVRGHRDLHEAHHAVLLSSAALLAHCARASALEELLRQGLPEIATR